MAMTNQELEDTIHIFRTEIGFLKESVQTVKRELNEAWIKTGSYR